MTFKPEFFEHEGGLQAFIDAPLPRKQIITGILHRGKAYGRTSLVDRMTLLFEAKISAGEKVVNAVVDCSPDIKGRAFEVALELRKKYEKQITINVGAYPIFGFKDRGSDRHLHLKELASRAQFLVGLPERDERSDHTVGFNGHLAILIELAIELKIPLQVHVDQTNTAEEDGTKKLVQATRWLVNSRLTSADRPQIWAVHMVSPSSYDENRFKRLLDGLRETNIGVVVCPHAAISMRQMRNKTAPIHNSVARVRELILAGIEVRLGTDNINDLFMPRPYDVLLSREIDVLASSLRYYDDNVLGKLARAERLNETDKDSVARSISGDHDAYGWQTHI